MLYLERKRLLLRDVHRFVLCLLHADPGIGAEMQVRALVMAS